MVLQKHKRASPVAVSNLPHLQGEDKLPCGRPGAHVTGMRVCRSESLLYPFHLGYFLRSLSLKEGPLSSQVSEEREFRVLGGKAGRAARLAGISDPDQGNDVLA